MTTRTATPPCSECGGPRARRKPGTKGRDSGLCRDCYQRLNPPRSRMGQIDLGRSHPYPLDALAPCAAHRDGKHRLWWPEMVEPGTVARCRCGYERQVTGAAW